MKKIQDALYACKRAFIHNCFAIYMTVGLRKNLLKCRVRDNSKLEMDKDNLLRKGLTLGRYRP